MQNKRWGKASLRLRGHYVVSNIYDYTKRDILVDNFFIMLLWIYKRITFKNWDRSLNSAIQLWRYVIKTLSIICLQAAPICMDALLDYMNTWHDEVYVKEMVYRKYFP